MAYETLAIVGVLIGLLGAFGWLILEIRRLPRPCDICGEPEVVLGDYHVQHCQACLIEIEFGSDEDYQNLLEKHGKV